MQIDIFSYELAVNNKEINKKGVRHKSRVTTISQNITHNMGHYNYFYEINSEHIRLEA